MEYQIHFQREGAGMTVARDTSGQLVGWFTDGWYVLRRT